MNERAVAHGTRLLSHDFVSLYVARFDKEHSWQHSDVAQAGVELVTGLLWVSPLIEGLADKVAIQALMKHVLNTENPSGIRYASRVLSALLRALRAVNEPSPEDPSERLFDPVAPLEKLPAVVSILVDNLPAILALLKNNPVPKQVRSLTLVLPVFVSS